MRHSRTLLASARVTLFLLACTPDVAHADTILNLVGRVRLGDGMAPTGTQIELQIDLDRNGTFDTYETVTATADASGNYNVAYALDPSHVDVKFVTFVSNLLAKYQSGGFDALVAGGPMPMAVTFGREGYSTLTKRLSTMLSTPSLDAMLAPLAKVGCSTSGCQSAGGDVTLAGFPGGTGITHAYAKAYDPRTDGSKFPGAFADNGANLLVSSGFTEIDLRDQGGNKVHTLPSPVQARYRLDPTSWPTIVDLAPGTGKIDVPMYSFDEGSAQWVSEGNGELQTADAKTLDESSLPAIRGGTFAGDVFVSFQTQHFSSWNVDRPVQTHTCVKGRVVDQTANAIAGLQVYAEGVSYTGTTASITTGADGFFVFDLMRSESPGEDIDADGSTGDAANVKLQVSGSGGVFTSAQFATPTAQQSVGSFGSPGCKPADCNCTQLPDTQVTLQPPRACSITVVAKYSGKSSSGTSPLAAGAIVAGASTRGELTGSASGFVGSSDSICQNQMCNSGTTDATGSVSFIVPVVGDAPSVKLSATLEQQAGTTVHYYTGTLVVDGCLVGQAQVNPVELDLDHVELSAMASFIAALGGGSQQGTAGTAGNKPTPMGCTMSPRVSAASAALFAVAMLGCATFVRRKRRGL